MMTRKDLLFLCFFGRVSLTTGSRYESEVRDDLLRVLRLSGSRFSAVSHTM